MMSSDIEWEKQKHGLDRIATVADRTEDRSQKGEDRKQDHEWAEADRNQDRDWKVDDRDDDRDWEFRKIAWEADYDRAKVIHDARVELAKGAVARAAAGAEFVRNAATGVVTIYTAVLGVRFGIVAGQTNLPVSGLIPALFLGLALTLATTYMAWLGRGQRVNPPMPSASLPVMEERRLQAFIEWASTIALNRAYFLHTAVLSLGVGVALLPAPFVSNEFNPWLFVAMLAGVLLIPVATARD